MQTITNFRDIGGIKNKAGKMVQTDVFLRSGELSNLSEEETHRLRSDYRLGRIVDLRSMEEIEKRPDRKVPQTEYIHIDIMKDVQNEGASLEDFIKIGSPEKAGSYMEKIYEDIALNRTSQKGYEQFFQEIVCLGEEESLLFHCFAGKDRTGIAALLLLETFDVPKEAIYDDYLRTNELRKKENELILSQANKFNLPEENLAALHVALNVEARYLDRFYEVIQDSYGDIQTYLKRAIGLDKLTRETMNERFLKV